MIKFLFSLSLIPMSLFSENQNHSMGYSIAKHQIIHYIKKETYNTELIIEDFKKLNNDNPIYDTHISLHEGRLNAFLEARVLLELLIQEKKDQKFSSTH